MVSKSNPVLRSALFWLAAAVSTLLMYWICLRFLFPKYFSPLSAFHVDFYDYVGAGEKTFLILLQRYPRPVSFMAMKVLGVGGLLGLMAGGIAIALVNVLLTLAIARKVFGLYSPWLLASFALYAGLLFAHPEFYIEHRHDLPAQVSYLFMAVGLLAWISWVQSRSASRKLIWSASLLVVSALSTVLFVFAKETYFLAAICLVAGMAAANRSDRVRHCCYLAYLLVCEACSFAWNLHINGPFVNPKAGGDNNYKISLAPGSVTHGFLFYFKHLFNPGLVVIVLLLLVVMWRDRRRFILTASFVLAGFAVVAPHAILPNHLFPEYSWAAAPLLLAPVLLLCGPAGSLGEARTRVALAASLAILTVVGPLGYRSIYHSDGKQWEAAEDRKGGELAWSLSAFRKVSAPARVLVVGLEDAWLPWQSAGFVHQAFGDGISWTVLLPHSIEFRRDSRWVHFTDAAHIQIGDFNYMATYRKNESLASLRPISEISASEPREELLVPALKDNAGQDSGSVMRQAAIALDWGLRDRANQLLEKAKGAGADGAEYHRLSAAAAAPLAQGEQKGELAAQPDHILQTDGSGLAETELVWKVPDGVFGEIHVDSPDGPLFTSGISGRSRTGKWVRNGMQFFLQDVTGGKPLTRANTLAQVRVEVTH